VDVRWRLEVTSSSRIFQAKSAMVVIMWLSLVSLICFKPAIDLFTVVWSRNGLLQYDSASLGNSLQTFLRNILPV